MHRKYSFTAHTQTENNDIEVLVAAVSRCSEKAPTHSSSSCCSRPRTAQMGRTPGWSRSQWSCDSTSCQGLSAYLEEASWTRNSSLHRTQEESWRETERYVTSWRSGHVTRPETGNDQTKFCAIDNSEQFKWETNPKQILHFFSSLAFTLWISNLSLRDEDKIYKWTTTAGPDAVYLCFQRATLFHPPLVFLAVEVWSDVVFEIFFFSGILAANKWAQMQCLCRRQQHARRCKQHGGKILIKHDDGSVTKAQKYNLRKNLKLCSFIDIGRPVPEQGTTCFCSRVSKTSSPKASNPNEKSTHCLKRLRWGDATRGGDKGGLGVLVIWSGADGCTGRAWRHRSDALVVSLSSGSGWFVGALRCDTKANERAVTRVKGHGMTRSVERSARSTTSCAKYSLSFVSMNGNVVRV